MIPITYIKRNIDTLTTTFNKSNKPLMTLLYAKMVIVEIGGWVELSMDDLVERAGKPLKISANTKLLDSNIIKNNYGFDYDAHFRKMLMQVIGLVNLERLERKLDIPTHTRMKAALGNLKSARNKVAHTYIKHASLGTIDAPSVSQTYFNDIYAGLKDIETKMKALKLI